MTDKITEADAPRVKRVGFMPPGVLPRNIQTWVIAGIALVMVLVIAISGRSPSASKASAVVPPAPSDPNGTRIREYAERVAEQTRRLEAEQAELNQAKVAFERGAGAGPGRMGTADLAVATPSIPRERKWTETELEKREFESRFASNIALSHREPVTDRFQGDAPETKALAETSKSDKAAPAVPNDEAYRLFEGTMIETTLTNRLDGSFSGPVNCMVTNDVYAGDRMTLLIPAGSRVLGEVEPVEAFGQKRLSVTFHRLILPNDHSISLDQFKGLNQVGETGLRDQVNNHYVQIFGVSIAIGAIAGLSQANTRYGAGQTGTDVYVQGIATSVSQSSLRVLDRFLNVLPTLTIQEGHRVRVYLSTDLLLPAYKKPMPRNP